MTAGVKINKTFFKYIRKERAVKETEGPLKNGKGNLLTQVVRALFKRKNEMNSSPMCTERRGDRCQKET